MESGIVCKTRKISRGRFKDFFTACFEVYESGKKIWSIPTGIRRLSREDALKDASQIDEDFKQ